MLAGTFRWSGERGTYIPPDAGDRAQDGPAPEEKPSNLLRSFAVPAKSKVTGVVGLSNRHHCQCGQAVQNSPFVVERKGRRGSARDEKGVRGAESGEDGRDGKDAVRHDGEIPE